MTSPRLTETTAAAKVAEKIDAISAKIREAAARPVSRAVTFPSMDPTRTVLVLATDATGDAVEE